MTRIAVFGVPHRLNEVLLKEKQENSYHYKNRDRDLTELYNMAAILRDQHMRDLNFKKLKNVMAMESIINKLKNEIKPAEKLVYYR